MLNGEKMEILRNGSVNIGTLDVEQPFASSRLNAMMSMIVAIFLISKRRGSIAVAMSELGMAITSWGRLNLYMKDRLHISFRTASSDWQPFNGLVMI